MTPPLKAETITFHLEKTNQFQTLHADGMVGGITPSRFAFLAFYVERAPLPQQIIRKIDVDGTLGEATVEGKIGIFRELHTGLTFTREGLEALKLNVENLIQELEETQS